MKKTQLVAMGAAFLIAATALSACSSGDDSTSGSEASNEATTAEAQSALDTAFAGIGSTLDDLASVKVADGISLYVVSCGEAVAGCSVPAASVKAAGEAAGWTATIADGKLSPDGFANAIRQSIAGGADVIVPIGIGCGVAQAAFAEAVAQGITIIGGGGVDDCDPKLWGSERLWLDGYTPQQQWESFGKLQADYVFGKTNGNVKAITVTATTQVWGQWITDGFNAELEKLGGGEVLANVEVSDQEQADGSYVQKVTTALLSNPDANALIVPIDSWLSQGIAAAIVQNGSDESLTVVGRGGEEAVLDMIRAGGAGVDATIGFATDWGAWGSVDTAIRVLAGTDPIFVGESMQAVDADNNMVTSGPYMGSVDFKSLFLKAWGK